MDDFLTKLYNEELEKNASAGREALFGQLPLTDLEAYLGLEKAAVGGSIEPDVSPAFKKAFQARESKGQDAMKGATQANSKSDTQIDRNIAPLKAGETIPERNINPQSPQISSSAKSLPDREYATQGETKQAQASFEWADQMGRALAYMEKEGSAPFLSKVAAKGFPTVAEIGKQLPRLRALAERGKYRGTTTPLSAFMEKATCMMGKGSDFTTPEAQAKAKVLSRAMKATKGAPPAIRKASVSVAAKQMRKEATTPGAIAGYLSQGEPQSTPRSGFWRGMGGGALGVGLGGMIGHVAGGNKGRMIGAGAGDVIGGILGGLTARATPEEKQRYLRKMLAEDRAAKK